MCGLCLSRRAVLSAALSLPFAANAAPSGVVEPVRRLARPPPGQLAVALTLDACPGAFDERLAAALIQSRIPATIFVTALWMRRNPAGLALLQAHPDVFGIENHGERHIPPVLGEGSVYGIPVAGDLATIQREVSNGAEAINKATGRHTSWYRAATGLYSPAAIPVIQQAGFAIAGYSLNGDMGASLPASSVAARIAKAGNGDVIVAHINQPHRPSGQGVADGVRALQSRGAVFLRLDQLGAEDLAAA